MSEQWLPSGSDQEDMRTPSADEYEEQIAALRAQVERLTQEKADIIRSKNECVRDLYAKMDLIDERYFAERDARINLEATLARVEGERDELKYRQQVIADTCGEELWSVRKQLAQAEQREGRLRAALNSLITAVRVMQSAPACLLVAEMIDLHAEGKPETMEVTQGDIDALWHATVEAVEQAQQALAKHKEEL